jgi:hypothetical protein
MTKRRSLAEWDWLGMFKRLFFLAIMMGAVGVPYLLTASSSLWNSVTSATTGSTEEKSTAAASPNDPKTAPHLAGGATSGLTAPKATPIEGNSVQDLNEVFRFDGSPEWVMTRWPRVTAGLAELDLQGYRVPLVTGTSAGDLAGSLTYYFDKDQHVAHITFHGTTGDPRKLISLVTSRFSLVQQKTDDPRIGLYQVKWNGKPLSELRIRPASVVRSNQPHTRYQVDLAVKRP